MKEGILTNGVDRSLAMIGRLFGRSIALAGAFIISDAIAGPEDPEDGGQWGPVIAWPHIPVSAANLPDGKILTYSGSERDTWPVTEQTYSATWDPGTGVFTEIFHSGHNMFCAHLAMMEDGRVFVNGGRNQTNSPWTSIFDYQDGPNGGWTQIQNMASGGRWYPTTLALPDGSIFTAIGTATLQNNPETWDPVNGWQIKNGISFNTMVLGFGSYSEREWWPLLHVAPNGQIFHSGPTPNMHYIDTTGNGSYAQTGAFNDWYHKHGTSIMYDEGKILTAGGWLGGGNIGSTNRVFTVDLNGPSPVVTVMPVDSNPLPALTKSMHHARKFHNGVMAPTGEVYVFGGNTSGAKFSDSGSVLTAEIWNPNTEEWREAAAQAVPRNYHSIALLLTDGRMLSAGGGYCSGNPTCGGASHPDGEVYTPPYLFDQNGNLAPRPAITSGDGTIATGQGFSVQATAGMQSFSLIKMSSTTHGVNTDVRFLNVPFTETTPGSYSLTAHANANVLTPGYWMLFALDANGVPSEAHVVLATVAVVDPLPWITTPANQTTAIGGNVNLQVDAGDGDGDPITFSATGLPPGLSIDINSGLISGVVTTLGVYQVTVTVDDSDDGTAEANFQWTVFDPIVSCPDCLDFNAIPTSSYSNQDEHANFAVEDSGLTFAVFDNTSRKSVQTFDIAANTVLEFDFESTFEGEIHGIGFDENNSHNDNVRYFAVYGTQIWNGANQDFNDYAGGTPEHYVIPVGTYYTGTDMHLVLIGDMDAGAGIGPNGRFSNVRILTGGNGNLAPTAANPGTQTTDQNDSVNLTITASDPNIGDTVTFSDGGSLPPGLSMNSGGDISGTATTIGDFNVTITADDGNGGTDMVSFQWLVCDPIGGCASNFLDFTTLPTTPYSNQDEHANFAVEDSGLTFALFDNTSRKTVQTFNVTADTMLEFDFWSSSEGEIHGIGFDENNSHNDDVRVFAVHGTQNWNGNNHDFNNYAGGGSPQHYVIPVGSYYTGSAMSLVFIGDMDAGPGIGPDGRFSNVFIYEAGAGELAEVVDPIAAESGTSASISITPNFQGLLFNWNFGDGTGDTGFISDSSVLHTYATPGFYVVTVTVRNPATSEETIYTFVQLIHAPLTANSPSISTSISVHPVQAQVWNVNPDNDSVTVIDTTSNSVIAEVPVGDKPSSVGFAPDGTAWVVNKGSATISIVDSASLTVTDTVALDYASQPHGIAFSPTAAHAFVALEATGDLVQIDANLRTELGRVYVGPNPRYLSVVADGSTVYVSRFITPKLPDENTGYPLVGLGALDEPIGVTEMLSGSPPVAQYFGGEVLVVDVATLTTDLNNPIILRWSADLVSEHEGPGLPNYLGPPVISPDDLGIWVPSKQDNILAGGAGGLRPGQGMTFDQTVRAVTSKIDRVLGDEIIDDRIDHDNASFANHAVFGPRGGYLYTTLEGNREVAVSNAYTGVEIFRFDVGRAPHGAALSSDGNTLYVHNFMDRTVGIYNISEITQRNNLVVSETATILTVGSETLAPNILLGKQFFYDARDPRLSSGPYMSCASCHNDGGADGRIWDFTSVGEGVRNTITLEGRAGTGHGFLHWSANFDEVQDFEAQIRNVAGGTGLMSDTDFFSGTRFQPLGDPKAGVSPDLDALAAYVASLNRVPDSPYRNSDGTLSVQAQTGKLVFEAKACASCHGPVPYTDSSLPNINLHDVGTITPDSGLRLGGPLTGLDTPTLLGIWQTGPYLHDGSAVDLTEAVAAHTGIVLTAQELDDVAFYLQELDAVTGDGCQDCLDFNVVSTNSYSNQDEYGNLSVEGNGRTFVLTDNSARRSIQTFDIAADTVLEFDFESTFEGEIHGIGFDENNDHDDGVRYFALYGTQSWSGSNQDFNDYNGGGSKHYTIPVGTYYTGSAMSLVFVNDIDAGAGIGPNSRFSNVRIVTGGDSNLPPTVANPGLQTINQNDSVNLSITAVDPNIGDTLSFSDGGTLPPGLSISSSGDITGTATTIGDYNVTITADDGNGGSDDETFQWSVCDPINGCTGIYLDFNTLPTTSYSSQDEHSNFAIEDGGLTFAVFDNTARITTQTFNITPDTVLEFDFDSTFEGEIHAIGFDEDNSHIGPIRVFAVYGTQNANDVNHDFDDYTGGGPKHYVIPVGQYYTGIAMRLVIWNDMDSGPGIGPNGRFSNVQIYESP